MKNIPIYRPQLPPFYKILPNLQDMYQSEMLYPSTFTGRLEERIKDMCGVSYTHAVSSCSLALVLLMNLMPRGSKVIIPSFTFSATLEALEWAGQIPLVVDVDRNGQLDYNLVAQALREHTDVSAILPVHMWGNACHPEVFENIAAEFGVRLFFDAAHNLGTIYKGRHIGTYGHATAHSIAATKPISAGEGGLVLTNYQWVDVGVRDGAAHGLVGKLDTRIRGINGKIQEFNSILALHALDRFDETKNRRREIIEQYRLAFKASPDVRVWQNVDEVDPMYKDCVIFVEDMSTRAALEKHLNTNGIGTKRYFDPAVADMGSFKGIVHSTKVGRELSQRCLTIPLYPALTNEDVQHIIGTIRSFFDGR
jgi:dTDP-4-amino-4,6-dideoxygalactose transaminase